MSKDLYHKLCEYLIERNIQCFLLSTNDRFLSEYVPDHYQRLNKLTAFTGSNGVALIFPHKKSFFLTDGRYVLQAQKQLDLDLFEIKNLAECSVKELLIANLNKGETLAIDSFLHNCNFVDSLRKESFAIKFTDPNPFDAIYGIPIIPDAKVFNHPLIYSGLDSEAKIMQLKDMLHAKGKFHYYVSADSTSNCWLLNLRGYDVPHTPVVQSYIVMDYKANVHFFFKGASNYSAIALDVPSSVRFYELDEIDSFVAAKFIDGKILLDPAEVPYWFKLKAELNNCKIVAISSPITELKSVKNEVELDGMRKCHLYDGLALSYSLYQIEHEKDLDELKVAAILKENRQKQPEYFDLSFPSIVGFNDHGAIIHYQATPQTNYPISKGNGNILLIDSGGQYLNGTTDVTRTIALGKPTNEQINSFTNVLKGHIAVASLKFPKGLTGSSIDPLARMFLWRYGKDYDHGTGHGVGSFLSVHEGPQRIAKAHNNVALKAGMIISNEPGFYRENSFGIRIESLVEVVESTLVNYLEFKTITKAPIDISLINVYDLTEFERNWLNSYHEEVYRDLSALKKDKKFLSWLKDKCRAI